MKIKQLLTGIMTAFGLSMALPAHAGVIFFSNDVTGFNQAVANSTFLGTEDFEQSTVEERTLEQLNPVLTQGVPNNFFPTGLNLPLTIEAAPGTFLSEVPDNILALLHWGPIENLDASILITHSGYGLNISVAAAADVDALSFIPQTFVEFDPANRFIVSVYGSDGSLLGTGEVPADTDGNNFFGVQTTDGARIGRVHIVSEQIISVGVDDISLYTAATSVPEPGSLGILGLGLLGLGAQAYRRRKA